MCSITGQGTTRLALGVCFALFASGCGGGRSPVPTAPSNPVISGPPAPPAPPVLTGPYSVTSVVADENGRPIEATSVDACCVGGSTYSHLVGGPNLTDSSGRFRMTGISAGALLWFRAYKDGYAQPCAAAPVTVQGNVTIDLALVSRANRTTATAPSAPGFRSASGTVVENTTTGKQPVAGAIVVFSEYEDFEPATTYSDQAGRFALCGLPAGQAVRLEAFSNGRGAYADVPPGQTTDVELVLR